MSTQRRESKGRRGARGRILLLERLEDRRLLATATEAFTGPSLSGLITQAYHGKNTGEAAIKTMLSALQMQLTDGPLADLNSNVVDGNGFVSEVQSLVASYNQNVDQQLLPHFTHIDTMLKLQGQQVVANLVSLNQQSTVGLIPSGSLPTQAGVAINTLTGGPIFSLNTPVSAYVTATQTFETDLGVVANTLSSTATTPLTLPKVSTTIQAEAEAYRASMDTGLQVTHPNISSTVNAAVTTLESSVISSTDESDINTAIAAFDAAILDTTGLFGLNGPVNQVNSELGYVPHNLTAKPTATTIDNVSGTATFGGPATLTATLINSATGTGIGGKVVSFTLDGAFAGTAVTDSSGVATLTGVPQSDTAGTDTGGIVASFAGDSTNKLSQNSGDLVVSQSSTTTTLTSSANPSASGFSVTFTATVAAVSPGSGTPTGTVTFDDNGTPIGTGTLSAGVATFSTSSLTVGTHSITAVYSGDTNFTTSTSTALSQAVNQAQAPAITSANSTTFTVGTAGSFTVTTTGFPTASLSETGTLPSGVTFVDNGNGTATLSGTPAAGTGKTYPLTITAANGVTPNATQSFTLTVNQAPAITSATSTTFTVGMAGSFTVTATGFPTPTLSETGALPSGVMFDAATGVLSGTPATGTAGPYSLTFTASNNVGSPATQPFTLTVSS
jgi:Bacterial Ig-like domain (group 3)/Putative Ig domain